MNTMYRSIGVPVLVTLLAGSVYLTGKYMEQQDMSPAVISVQGEGKVMASPDIAELSFGITTQRQQTAEEAMRILTEDMQHVLDAVKAEGIEDKDITTQQLSLQPAYDWEDGKRTNQGFEARQNLSVRVRETSKIGNVLTAATTAGANQVGGVQFTIDDPEELRTQAREDAIAQAQEKADVLAKQLGKRVGDLRGYAEGGSGMPPVMYERAMMLDNGDSQGAVPLPVPTGEQKVNVTVTLSYELR